MDLKLKIVLLGLAIMTSVGVGAQENDPFFNTITEVDLVEISHERLTGRQIELLRRKDISIYSSDEDKEKPDQVQRAGAIIKVSRDLVALGEEIYRLVVKGKPTNKTSYAPISVVPKINGEAVDILDTEGWSVPVKRTFRVGYKNLYGIEVVVFQFSVLYSYNGSYNGAGKYLTSVQVVPESVRTLFGFDFTATMKLGGIQNQGTKANPVAGVTILVEHTVGSVMNAINKVNSFFITGRGEFKAL